ncbi:MAG: hypothetical protein LAO19_04630 [Acidobacteriia bacterium]|nr:hypothetical protein [Terriglobia bacterium]
MFLRIIAVLVLMPFGARAQSAPVDPMALRTRDAHQDLTIVADPYVTAERYTAPFGKNSPFGAGIAAIDVYFKNDGNAPVRIDLNTIRLVVSLPGVDRQQLEPLSPEEVADRTLLKAEANPKLRRPFPFPNSGSSGGKSKAWNEMDTLLRSVAVSSDILPPHATTHGFLFFDVNHDFNAIRYSHLYIPDLSFMTDKKALFFFEIDLGAGR